MCDMLPGALIVTFIVVAALAMLLASTWLFTDQVHRRLELEKLLERAAPNRDRARYKMLVTRLLGYRDWLGATVRSWSESQERLDTMIEQVTRLDRCLSDHLGYSCGLPRGHDGDHQDGPVSWSE